ncbi:MAG: L,D-transpeptidase [bacterium]|nr:L,D-transpeptidase [bacterium]
MSTLTATLLALILSVPTAPLAPVDAESPVPVAHEIAMENWEIQQEDKVIVDTKNNLGYIFHADGTYINFDVVTGQQRWVYYIGRSYNASTPNWNWTVKSKHIKGDRLTFGPSGRFLRLYKNGEDHTAYGFHEYGQEDEIFNGMDTRFRSMGCIIVRVPIMDLLVSTFEQNGSIDVITVKGIHDLQKVMMTFGEDSTVALY